MTSWHESFIPQFTISLKKEICAEAGCQDFIWIILHKTDQDYIKRKEAKLFYHNHDIYTSNHLYAAIFFHKENHI